MILPDLPVRASGKIHFYSRNKNGEEIEKINYEVYIQNSNNNCDLAEELKKFEESRFPLHA